jgi:HSP20 family protein
MALVRWQPFREIDEMQKEMNRIFDSLVPVSDGGIFSKEGFAPAVELDENEEAVLLKLELPGLKPEDLDIQVTADSVSIAGERKYEKTTEEKGVTRSEFRYGKFQRVIPLPARIKNTEAAAEYKDGILHLTLPKAEEEKSKVYKLSLTPAD